MLAPMGLGSNRGLPDRVRRRAVEMADDGNLRKCPPKSFTDAVNVHEVLNAFCILHSALRRKNISMEFFVRREVGTTNDEAAPPAIPCRRSAMTWQR